MHELPGREHLLNARRLLAPHAHITPVLTCKGLDTITGTRLFFKCENFQKVGAFKFRGAMHALLNRDTSNQLLPVATHSSGNHAQALSLAAKIHGLKAYIVMPENAPRVKVHAVGGYGGEITFCAPTLESRESTLKAVIERTAAEEIHPYNDYRIIAGQATASAELSDAVPDLDYIIAPVGGGGLLSGTILSTGYFSPATRVIGAEPEMANDAWKSWKEKAFVPSLNPQTVADGLRTSLGSLTLPIILQGVHTILMASEEGIIRSMLLIWERMKIVVEPSAAVPLAVVLENPEMFVGKKTGIIVSGGNIDLSALTGFIEKTEKNEKQGTTVSDSSRSG